MSLYNWVLIVKVVVEILREILNDENGLADDIINLGKRAEQETENGTD